MKKQPDQAICCMLLFAICPMILVLFLISSFFVIILMARGSNWSIYNNHVFFAAPFFQCLLVPVTIRHTDNHDNEIQIIVEILLFIRQLYIFVFAAHLTVPSPREGSVSPQSQKRSMSGTPSGRKTQIHTSF